MNQINTISGFDIISATGTLVRPVNYTIGTRSCIPILTCGHNGRKQWGGRAKERDGGTKWIVSNDDDAILAVPLPKPCHCFSKAFLLWRPSLKFFRVIGLPGTRLSIYIWARAASLEMYAACCLKYSISGSKCDHSCDFYSSDFLQFWFFHTYMFKNLEFSNNLFFLTWKQIFIEILWYQKKIQTVVFEQKIKIVGYPIRSQSRRLCGIWFLYLSTY